MMKIFPGINSRIVLVLAVMLGAQLARVVSAEQAPIMYKPPLRGAPQARVGGGTRGTGGEPAVLQILVPDHAGLTTQAQPTIYWYARTPAAARFEFALIDDEGIDPLLEVEMDSDRVSGFRQLSLGDYGITLQPGVPYQWSVALVSDGVSRSSDLVSSGIIKRIEPGDELSGRVGHARGSELVGVYASEGIWYDALDTVSRLIEQSPADQSLVAIRDSLLAQVGLRAVTGK